MLAENRPEMMRMVIHERLEADLELDAHREAKKWIERNHNKYVKLLECKIVGEYAYNSILVPDNLEEGIAMEPNDPQ